MIATACHPMASIPRRGCENTCLTCTHMYDAAIVFIPQMLIKKRHLAKPDQSLWQQMLTAALQPLV
jgi:hypothetical protein